MADIGTADSQKIRSQNVVLSSPNSRWVNIRPSIVLTCSRAMQALKA